MAEMKTAMFLGLVVSYFALCSAISQADTKNFVTTGIPESNSGLVGYVIVTGTGGNWTFESNGVPDHDTGNFPNDIIAQRNSYVLPKEPSIASEPSCLPSGPIAMAVNGVVMCNPWDENGMNAVEGSGAEMFDMCDGKSDNKGVYCYRRISSSCLYEVQEGIPSPLKGVAFDGFAIYGPIDENRKRLTSADLDECHGRKNSNGVYQYHATSDFPYILGCYKGLPVRKRENNCYFASEADDEGNIITVHAGEENTGLEDIPDGDGLDESTDRPSNYCPNCGTPDGSPDDRPGDGPKDLHCSSEGGYETDTNDSIDSPSNGSLHDGRSSGRPYNCPRGDEGGPVNPTDVPSNDLINVGPRNGDLDDSPGGVPGRRPNGSPDGNGAGHDDSIDVPSNDRPNDGPPDCRLDGRPGTNASDRSCVSPGDDETRPDDPTYGPSNGHPNGFGPVGRPVWRPGGNPRDRLRDSPSENNGSGSQENGGRSRPERRNNQNGSSKGHPSDGAGFRSRGTSDYDEAAPDDPTDNSSNGGPNGGPPDSRPDDRPGISPNDRQCGGSGGEETGPKNPIERLSNGRRHGGPPGDRPNGCLGGNEGGPDDPANGSSKGRPNGGANDRPSGRPSGDEARPDNPTDGPSNGHLNGFRPGSRPVGQPGSPSNRRRDSSGGDDDSSPRGNGSRSRPGRRNNQKAGGQPNRRGKRGVAAHSKTILPSVLFKGSFLSRYYK